MEDMTSPLHPLPPTTRQRRRTHRRVVAVWGLALVTVALVATNAVVTATPTSGTDWLGLVVMVVAVGSAWLYERWSH